MEEEKVREFAKERFSRLSQSDWEWNALHSKCMIESIYELTGDRNTIEKLRPLAWVHDLGKTEIGDNHAQASVRILEKDFDLDSVDKDCILNHGSSGKPTTPEGKIFQAADGLSLFCPESVLFWFYSHAKKGESFAEIKADLEGLYSKYIEAYADRPKAIKILKGRAKIFFE
jgi:hypothetical protein